MSEAVQYLTKEVVKNLNDCIVVLDTETTGFSKYKDRIVEFGALKLKQGHVIDEMNVLITVTVNSSSFFFLCFIFSCEKIGSFDNFEYSAISAFLFLTKLSSDCKTASIDDNISSIISFEDFFSLYFS